MGKAIAIAYAHGCADVAIAYLNEGAAADDTVKWVEEADGYWRRRTAVTLPMRYS